MSSRFRRRGGGKRPTALRPRAPSRAMSLLQPLLGLVVIVAVAWAVSENRRALPWGTVLVGILLQLATLALLSYGILA